MSLRRLFPVLAFVWLSLAMEAGDWSSREPLDSNQGGTIELRYRRDEGRDDQEKGYGFVYQINNTSNRQGARVSFCFGTQDPQTGRWSNPSKGEVTKVLEVGPGGTASGTVYSPYPASMDYFASVEWVDGLTSPPEKEEGTGATPGDPSGEDEGKGKSPDDPAGESPKEKGPTFEGVPLTDVQGVLGKLRVSEHFRVALVLHWQGSDEYPAAEGSAETITWQQATIGLLESYRDPHYLRPGVSLASFQIRKSSAKEIIVEFDDICREHLEFLLGVETNPPPDILELSALGNGSLVSGEEKIIPASRPRSEAKPVAAPVSETKRDPVKAAPSRHNGYWFDPGDKEAKGEDPMIYVRVDGTARRMKLSVAKRDYGVPGSATKDTMSVYMESLGMLVKDLGTHRAQPGR